MAEARTYEDNLAAATGYLARFAEAPLPHLIGGEAMPSASGETFTNHSPIDGHHLGDVSAGDADDIDAAAKAAVQGFGVWSSMPGAERKVILHKVADLIEENAHQIAVTECIDTGQTMRFMGHAARPVVADCRSCELHDSRSNRSSRGHYAMEHPVHAQHVEDCAGTRRWLQRRAQACRVEPVHGAPVGRDGA